MVVIIARFVFLWVLCISCTWPLETGSALTLREFCGYRRVHYGLVSVSFDVLFMIMPPEVEARASLQAAPRSHHYDRL